MSEPRLGAGDAEAASAALLDARTLYGIAPLELRARVLAEGVLAGVHRSRRFGSSSEFAEHKVYAPGDDLRHLDWKAYARMDRYFVRRYEDETGIDVALVVDASASMAYAGGARGSFALSKIEAARTLAAAIAWIAVRHSDASGVTLFAEEERAFVAPRARRDHLSHVMDALERVEARGTTALEDALLRVGERTSRRSLVVLLSDLLACGPSALSSLGILRRRGCDVLVLHVLDRDELELPFDGVVRFQDIEGSAEVQVDVPLVRTAYREELQRFLQDVRSTCSRLDLRYALAATDLSPVATLASALAAGPLLRGGR